MPGRAGRPGGDSGRFTFFWIGGDRSAGFARLIPIGQVIQASRAPVGTLQGPAPRVRAGPRPLSGDAYVCREARLAAAQTREAQDAETR